MNKFSFLSIFCVTAAALIPGRPGLVYASRDDAREMIASGARLPDAINELSSLAQKPDATIAAEYSLALATSGLSSAALNQMDRAFILDPTDDEVLYAGGTLLAWLGLTQAADELKRTPPEWVKGPLPLLSKSHKRSDVLAPMGTYGAELLAASQLMEKSRFISACDRFARLTAVYPKEPLGWSGYAIALENIGAFKTAAKAVAMELNTDTRMDAGEHALLVQHEKELIENPPVTKKKLNESLKGRYTALADGSLSGGNGASSTYSFGGQVGKFFTNTLNVSLDLSFSSVTHLTTGIGERWFFSLPVPGAVSLTAGSRIEYDSTPSTGTGNVGLLLSPGLSFFIGNGSLDMFVDFGVAGAQKGTETFTMGYTFFFGGAGV